MSNPFTPLTLPWMVYRNFSDAHQTYQKGGPMALGKQIAFESVLAVPMIGGVGRSAKVARGAHSAWKSSKLSQIFRTVKRPVTSTMTRLGYSGVPEKIVTRYGYAKFGVGLLDPLATTRALSRGDYDEAIIGFYGPPGSVHLYRKALESLASSSSPSQQNGGAKGKKTSTRSQKSKPKYLYKKRGQPCPPGYRASGGQCVLIGRR